MPQPNPQMQAVLDELQLLGPKPIETLTPEEARKQPTPTDAVMSLLKKQGLSAKPAPVGNVDERNVPGPAGDVKVRVYTPTGSGPFPVLVYVHGGGWVIATLDTYDASCRALCNAVPCVVVSVDYRQAPEHPFPAPLDDVYAVWRWTVANAAEINGDPRNVAIAGESAGGNMATVVARLARDNGVQLPVHQLLVYPVTDYNFDTPSYLANANAKPLSRAMMMWFAKYYQANPADPRAAPLRAADLSGLPPATVILAEIDPLHSEGEAYISRLRAAGVPTRGTLFDGVTHEFFGMGAVLDAAKEAETEAADELRKAFGSGATPAVAGSQRAAAMTGDVAVAVGDTVLGADAELVGRVKQVRDMDVLVDRKLQRDIYVPLASIAEVTGGQVTLTVPSGQVDDMGWANP